MYTRLPFVLGISALILVPFVPSLIRLRVRVLRWLHWNWAVNLIESHFQGWVVFGRIILCVIAALLLYIGLAQ